MDPTTVAIVAILALVLVAALLTFRQKGKGSIKVGSIEASYEGENPTPPPPPNPGVYGSDLTAGGGITAENKAGDGVRVERAKADEDIVLRNTPPPGEPDPKKAQPPAP